MRLIGVDTPEVYGEAERTGARRRRLERLLALESAGTYSLGVEQRDLAAGEGRRSS